MFSDRECGRDEETPNETQNTLVSFDERRFIHIETSNAIPI